MLAPGRSGHTHRAGSVAIAPRRQHDFPTAGKTCKFIGCSSVNHEFQQVPIWVTHIDARACLPTPSFPGDWAELDLCRRAIQRRLERVRGAFPYEAEVTTGWDCSRSSIRE